MAMIAKAYRRSGSLTPSVGRNIMLSAAIHAQPL